MNTRSMELHGWQGSLLADSGHDLNDTQCQGSDIICKYTDLIIRAFAYLSFYDALRCVTCA
jgi:hypothetical protein